MRVKHIWDYVPIPAKVKLVVRNETKYSVTKLVILTAIFVPAGSDHAVQAHCRLYRFLGYTLPTAGHLPGTSLHNQRKRGPVPEEHYRSRERIRDWVFGTWSRPSNVRQRPTSYRRFLVPRGVES